MILNGGRNKRLEVYVEKDRPQQCLEVPLTANQHVENGDFNDFDDDGDYDDDDDDDDDDDSDRDFRQ